MYKCSYHTPDGFDDILLISDGEYLTGLHFVSSKDAQRHTLDCEQKDLPIFRQTIKWLDIYFSGKNPDFVPKYKITGLTHFRQDVLDILNTIPYGKTLTYGDIAKIIAKKQGLKSMSCQAVGGAVGWNPICIIIPCHRVVGSNGSLTGYSGGIQNKVALLSHEHNDMSKLFVPKKS